MDNWWARIAVVVIVIVAAVVIARKFLPSESERSAEPAAKTFQDVIAEDDRTLRAEPKFEDIKQAEQPVAIEPKPQPTPEFKGLSETEPEPQPAPKFKELSEVEKVEAERLFEFALQQRKIGRLPVTGYKPMVDACREIIRKFQGSKFDYKARRMLADIPERYRRRYKITKEEIDLTRFFK